MGGTGLKQIILYCGNYVDGSIVWENSGNGVLFNTVKCIEIVNTKHITGRDLRESEYRHKLSTRKKWDITISADQLVDNNLKSFIVTFYKSTYWEITIDNVTHNVVLEDGDIPFTYLENNIHLPEIKFTLTQRNPD